MTEGLFWIICTMTDTAIDWSGDWELLHLFAKSDSISHKDAWARLVQPEERRFRRIAFDHYPRGRVVVRNGKATVFLNQHIATDEVIAAIAKAFDLTAPRVHPEGSGHYKCFIDGGSHYQ